MAATLTGIYSVGVDLFVAHVGHSRCYLFRSGLLVQLASDDTLQERRAVSPFPIPIGRPIDDGAHLLTEAVGASADSPNAIVEQFRLEE
jgi:serine/threonine protein phosphatase PrpC